ncbi:NMDA receptor-regulated protein 1-domain-containing protein [Pisolithus croceorrhizus]|nr:NMDA receptor-regulated protein 1-domain-containing protein [Pisolithus croceorrhizus]
MASQQVTLAQKDRKAFQDLLSCYELKQLTRGRKVADQILKKYPDHGETMCMKGLILVHLGQRDEGIKLIREGMRKDLTSHICWHVWALVQKGEHKYEEALKSYMQALRFDKDNFNIIRETSVLQTQTRAYESLVESRVHMLRLRPSVRAHWVGLAVAYQLSGNLVEAKRVLEHFQNLLREGPVNDAEYSEFLLFHVHVLEDLGHLQDALAFLDKKSKDRYIVDRTATHTFRARILSKLKNTNKGSPQAAEWNTRAESEWRALLDLNPECSDYYRAVLANQGIDLDDLDEESRTKALELLSDFSVHFPKAYAPRQLALTVAQDDKFRELVQPYIEMALSKGIPSLFSDLKKLYGNPFKCQAIEEIVEDIRASSLVDQASPPEPAEYLWTLYFLAQHYSFLGRHQKALEILNLAVEHTPTLPELYMTRAKLLKRAGDPYGAVRSMDEARKLDGQDRFINTKSGKYRLRAGMVDEAEEIFGLFTRKGAATPGADLTEMQALHYLVEVGDAYRRIGKLNLALKKYYAIQKVFEAFREDQYDFHQYSIRKTILLPYFDMLKWEDEVHSHPSYVHAVVSAARIWIELHDDPSLGKLLQPSSETTDASKKALSKAKKAAHRGNDPSQESQDVANKKVSNQSEDKGLDAPIPKDEDPDGVKMVLADDTLERAAKFLATLKESGKRNIDACLANFDVATRRKKYLQAARALVHAHALNAQHPELHLRVVQFGKTVSSVSDSIARSVKSVLHETLTALKSEEISLDVFTSQYLQSHSTSPSAILACAQAYEFLGNPAEDIESLLFTTLKDNIGLSVEDALRILSYLQRVKSTRAEEFRIACDNKFELSTVFKSSDEQAALRQQCLLEEKEDCDDVEIL